MSLAVHGTHCNNLSREVDRNDPWQLPTRIGRNKKRLDPACRFERSRQYVRLRTGTIAVPNDCSKNTDRECAAPGAPRASTGQNAEVPVQTPALFHKAA
jgi:hypothetical protein